MGSKIILREESITQQIYFIREEKLCLILTLLNYTT